MALVGRAGISLVAAHRTAPPFTASGGAGAQAGIVPGECRRLLPDRHAGALRHRRRYADRAALSAAAAPARTPNPLHLTVHRLLCAVPAAGNRDLGYLDALLRQSGCRGRETTRAFSDDPFALAAEESECVVFRASCAGRHPRRVPAVQQADAHGRHLSQPDAKPGQQ